MCSNRISCLIALCKTCFLLTCTCHLAHGSCSLLTQWTMTKLWPNCFVLCVISNNVHRLVILENTHCTCKIEATSILWTWWHLWNWWHIAKLKVSNELEHRALIYRMTYDTYMLCANHGSGQSMDCAAQSMDPCFARAIHGLPSSCAIHGLRNQAQCTRVITRSTGSRHGWQKSLRRIHHQLVWEEEREQGDQSREREGNRGLSFSCWQRS